MTKRTVVGWQLACFILATLTGWAALAQGTSPGRFPGATVPVEALVDAHSHVDVVDQINALSAACAARCVIHLPAGEYVTHAAKPIVLGAGQSLVGDGEQLSDIRVAPDAPLTKLLVWHARSEAEFWLPAGRLADVALHGGGNRHITELVDMGDLLQSHMERLMVDGAPAGDCLSVQNRLHWTERMSLEDVTLGNAGGEANSCAVNLHVRAPEGKGTVSYGYADWRSLYQNVFHVGVQIDASVRLYNALDLNIQGNLDTGTAELVRVGGLITAARMELTGEAGGTTVHVLKGGQVAGCGTNVNQLGGFVVDGPTGDTHTPLDLTDCGGLSSAVTLKDFGLTGQTTSFQPYINHHSSTGEVNAGLAFLEYGDRMGAPALYYDQRSYFSLGTINLYQPIGAYAPKWWISGQGDVTEVGSLGVGGCSPPGANHGDNVVHLRLCAQNTAELSQVSQISNKDARMWGSYVVRTQDGNAQWVFGAMNDAGAMTAGVMDCERNAGVVTVCHHAAPEVFAKAIATPSVVTLRGTPGSSHEACRSGESWDDDDFHYHCTSKGVLKRAALSAF